MKSLSRSLLVLLICAAVTPNVQVLAETASDLNEGSILEHDSENGIFRFKWFGKSGRTYFIQHAEDLMQPWLYVPIIEPGDESIREWGFTSTGDRFFLRLKYSDIPTADPWNDDFDGDKVSNYLELENHTDPLKFADTDDDTMPDDWETYQGLNPTDAGDVDGDFDGDGLANRLEYQAGTLANVADSDSDGMPDGWEAARGLNPLANDAQSDADGDGLTNLKEYTYGFDPNDPADAQRDADANGILDWWELEYFGYVGVDPDDDADADGVTNGQEFQDGANPLVGDGDGDGDGIDYADEVNVTGTDPTAPDLFLKLPPEAGFPWAEHDESANPAPWVFFSKTLSSPTYPATGDGVRVFVQFENASGPVDDDFKINDQVIVSIGNQTGSLYEITSGWNLTGPNAASAVSTIQGGAYLSPFRIIYLLPVQMKLLWETENKANQIHNPTKKDDPWGGGGYEGYGSEQNGAPRNKLFLVPDPEGNKYKTTIEVEMPEQLRTKFYAAAYVGETKVANSDKVFDSEGKCELEFEHLGTSNDIEDFAIRIGYDANDSRTLDPGEITKLDVKSLGEPIVRGTKASKYNDAKSNIDGIISGSLTSIGTDLLLPHAKRFLQIFRDGGFGATGFPDDKKPTSSTTISFDAFNGYFSEWLTHNSGAPFSDEGVAKITDYTWGPLTSTANLLATSPQIEGLVRNYYNSSVAALAAAHFASLPVGSPPAYFPSETGFYDIPHTHESPAWVPVTSVTFDLWLPNQGDDVNGTIGRGRLLNHKARYRVEKLSVDEGPPDAPYCVERLVVTRVVSQGVAIDLYDFNHMVGGAAQDAAILQIGFGKGAYGADRDRGKIYRNRIEFDKIHTSLP